MAMVLGHVIMTEAATGIRQSVNAGRAVLKLVRDNNRELLIVKREHIYEHFNLTHLNGLYDTENGYAALRFLHPLRQIIVQTAGDDSGLSEFINFIRTMVYHTGQLDNSYFPSLAEYMSIDRYDNLTHDIGCHLNMLVLENIDATGLSVHIAQMPLSYINLSGCILNTTNCTYDWDWMSSPITSKTLTKLVINSVGLETVPFEIMFLKKLQILSLASNKLTHLPPFLGDLRKLDCLFVDNNLLTYLPICLKDKLFKHLNISNNKLMEFSEYLHNEDKQYLRTKRSSKTPVSTDLFSMSFYTIIYNSIKFKRQDLFHKACQCFDRVYRCIDCNQLMIPHENTEFYEFGYASTVNFVKSILVAWQTFECNNSKCYTNNKFFQLKL